MWTIEYSGESCQLPDMLGLEYIEKVLTGDGPPTFVWTAGGRGVHREVVLIPLAAHTEEVPETTRAVTPSRLRTFIADAEKRAQQAWTVGDKGEHDRLRVEVSRIRAYLTANTAQAGKSRIFANESSRDVDSVRKAITRAITAIRKQSVVIADHFKASILYGGAGCWYYDGDHSSWEMLVGKTSPAHDRQFFPLPVNKEPSPDEIEAVRARWLGEHQAVPPGGKCTAERSCPYPAVFGGVCRDHYRTATLEFSRGNVLRELRTRIGWDICREPIDDKSLEINRPAYTSRDVFGARYTFEKDFAEEKEAGGSSCGSPEGDDREADAFESER